LRKPSDKVVAEEGWRTDVGTSDKRYILVGEGVGPKGQGGAYHPYGGAIYRGLEPGVISISKRGEGGQLS